MKFQNTLLLELIQALVQICPLLTPNIYGGNSKTKYHFIKLTNVKGHQAIHLFLLGGK